MRTTKHSETMLQLSNLFPANMYLVREDDGFTLIDTGLSGGAQKILASAEANGAAIRRIVLTHGHADHIGSLDALHALLPDAEVLVSERTAQFMRGDMTLNADEPQAKIRGGWVTSQTTPTRLLKAGDRVGSLEVIAAPGHSPDHVAYLDTRNGTLFAGDAFSTQAGIHTAGTLRLLFPFTSMATWHKPTALHSAETLVALRPTRLATGHGKVLSDPVPAMQRAIAEAKRSIEGGRWQPSVV